MYVIVHNNDIISYKKMEACVCMHKVAPKEKKSDNASIAEASFTSGVPLRRLESESRENVYVMSRPCGYIWGLRQDLGLGVATVTKNTNMLGMICRITESGYRIPW